MDKDGTKPTNQVIRDAVHRGFVGGTSGAMAMTIQVSRIFFLNVISKIRQIN